jgi:hypothetical protein
MNSIYKLFCGIIILSLVACQREVVFEDNKTAAGSLKSATNGDCLPATVAGLYKKDTVLSAGNYIEIQARISRTGSYTIYSDTINGYYFRSVGSVADTGLQTIRLMGTGKPLATGINNFSIHFENSICKVAVAVSGASSGSAIFGLGTNGNSCSGVVLGGSYTAGLLMTNQNTARVVVSVSSIGTYSISTDTVNGVSFSLSGVFSTTGSQQVTLNATGTAQNAGTFTYIVNGGASQCEFTVTYTASSPNAVFSTINTAGQCNPISINGTYKAGQPLTGSNFIVVEVTVITPGDYSLTTTTAVNGIGFNAAGTFTSTGTFPVTLWGIGTPLLAGTHTYTIVGPNGCSFDLTTQPTGGSSTGIFTCKIDGVFTTFNINAHAKLSYPQAGWGQALELIGKATNTTAENIYIVLLRTQNAAPIVPGNYGWGTSFNYLQFYYYPPDASFWYGISTINMEYITITSISPTTVKGTFSGKVFEGGGWGPGFKVMTEGQFDVPVQ